MKVISFGYLVRHDRPYFRGAIDLEPFITQSHAVGRGDGHGKHTPSGQVVRHFKLNGRPAFTVSFQRWIPVADEFKNRAHTDIGTAAAAGIRSLFFKLLAADQTGQETIILQVQTSKMIKALIGIEIITPVEEEVKYRLIKDSHRKLNGFLFIRVSRSGL